MRTRNETFTSKSTAAAVVSGCRDFGEPCWKWGQQLLLDTGAVDLWVTAVPSCMPVAGEFWSADILSGDEAVRNSQFRSEAARVRDRMTRIFVRQILSGYCLTPARGLKFGRTELGRPFLIQDTSGVWDRDFSFSISHSARLIIVAVARRRRVGVDVEDAARLGRILTRCLSKDEVEGMAALPPGQRWNRFLELWTLKESYVKATGVGLRLPLANVEFLYQDESSVAARFSEGVWDSADRWNFQVWTPHEGSISSLCMEMTSRDSPVVCVRRVGMDGAVSHVQFAALRSSVRWLVARTK